MASLLLYSVLMKLKLNFLSSIQDFRTEKRNKYRIEKKKSKHKIVKYIHLNLFLVKFLGCCMVKTEN